jgi:hypothetical protein
MCGLSQFKKQKHLFLDWTKSIFSQRIGAQWAVISGRHVFGPYFFEGSVIQHLFDHIERLV